MKKSTVLVHLLLPAMMLAGAACAGIHNPSAPPQHCPGGQECPVGMECGVHGDCLMPAPPTPDMPAKVKPAPVVDDDAGEPEGPPAEPMPVRHDGRG